MCFKADVFHICCSRPWLYRLVGFLCNNSCHRSAGYFPFALCLRTDDEKLACSGPLSYAFQWSVCQAPRLASSITSMARATAQWKVIYIYIYFFLNHESFNSQLPWRQPSPSSSEWQWQLFSAYRIFLTLPHTESDTLMMQWPALLPRCIRQFSIRLSWRQRLGTFEAVVIFKIGRTIH